MTEATGLETSIPKEAWTPVDCGLCGSAERDLKFREGLFSVVTCQHCGLTYVTPRLTESSFLAEVYDEGYWRSQAAKARGYTDYRADQPLYLKTYRRRLRVIRRHFGGPGRVLDVGCAAGYFLCVMQDEGWRVTGLEPSDAIRSTAEALVGKENVHAGLLGQVALEPASFELVTMWDVVEHIPDPVAALQEVRRLLAPGGRLVIETQNIDSGAARVLGKRWQHYKHAEHLFHFNKRTIAEVLRRAGFEVLENRPWLGGKYVSMGFIAERAGRFHPVVSALLSPLKLLRGVSVYVNLLDEMIVVARPS